MKNIILSLFIILNFACKAQTSIIPVYESGGFDVDNAYYKDVDNFNDQFVGSWVFDDGVTYLKVTFKNKPMFPETFVNKSYYVDYLIGEYEYKLNGVPVVNTLSNLNVNHSSIFKYNMLSTGRQRSPLYFPSCSDCFGAKRLEMKFQELPSRDPKWDAEASFIMRRVMVGGVEKLKVIFDMTSPAGRIPADLGDEYQGFSLPFGDYVLTKQ